MLQSFKVMCIAKKGCRKKTTGGQIDPPPPLQCPMPPRLIRVKSS